MFKINKHRPYTDRGKENRESKLAWKQYIILRRIRKQKRQAIKREKALSKIKWYGKPNTI